MCEKEGWCLRGWGRDEICRPLDDCVIGICHPQAISIGLCPVVVSSSVKDSLHVLVMLPRQFKLYKVNFPMTNQQ